VQRDSKGKWVVALALVVIACAGIWAVSAMSHRRVAVAIGSSVVQAQIADTESSRQRGLSGVGYLAEGEAMLFVFETPGRWGMWMKDMKISLDMLWLDENKKVIYIERNVTPGTYPKTFVPDSDGQYVLELPAGYADKHGVGLGQTLAFSVN
jgi:uncharacterized protein